MAETQEEEEKTLCGACGQPVEQLGGGHRKRLYCDDVCRQRAFQARREQAHKDEIARRWAHFEAETRGFLDWIATRGGYGEDLATAVEAAITREIEARQRGLDQVQERFRQYVETTNARLSDLSGRLADYRKAEEAASQAGRFSSVSGLVTNDSRHAALQAELLAMGEALHWRFLINGQTAILRGEEAWKHYITETDTAGLAAAVRAARHYYDNLNALGMLGSPTVSGQAHND